MIDIPQYFIEKLLPDEEVIVYAKKQPLSLIFPVLL